MRTIETQSQTTETSEICPECGAEMPVNPGYITWCDKCNWNVSAQQPRTSDGILDSVYMALGKRLGQGMLKELMGSGSLKPRVTAGKVLAYGVATVVHLITLLSYAAGLFLVIAGWPAVAMLVPGMLLLWIAWTITPRAGNLSPDDLTLNTARFPALYDVATNVARSVGLPDASTILIQPDFNAFFGQIGWRRRKVLGLGLPLVSILNPQEFVALLAHEYAHGVNGDPTRGWFIGTAIGSLVGWYTVLHKPNIRIHHLFFIVLVPFSIMVILLIMGLTGLWISEFLVIFGHSLPILLTLFAILALARSLITVLLHLLWRDMQRAEYLADAMAIQICGSGAMLSLLEKLHLYASFHSILRRTTLYERDRNVFDELRQALNRVPERELQRIRRVEKLLSSRLDMTHPPTAYRVDLIAGSGAVEPMVTLALSDFDRIRQELASLEPTIQAEIIDMYNDSLYA
jgi:Zn-dependent protease with chaperone function